MAHIKVAFIICEMDLFTPRSCLESIIIAWAGLLLETRLLKVPG